MFTVASLKGTNFLQITRQFPPSPFCIALRARFNRAPLSSLSDDSKIRPNLGISIIEPRCANEQKAKL